MITKTVDIRLELLSRSSVDRLVPIPHDLDSGERIDVPFGVHVLDLGEDGWLVEIYESDAERLDAHRRREEIAHLSP